MLLCPVTVVKTRMEYGPTSYRSTVGAIVRIAQTERFSGLFKGLVPTLVSQVPFSALHYMIYRWLQSHLQVGIMGSKHCFRCTVLNWKTTCMDVVPLMLFTFPPCWVCYGCCCLLLQVIWDRNDLACNLSSSNYVNLSELAAELPTERLLV